MTQVFALLIGASAALTISGLPFLGPVGCSRVGYKDGKYILNPTTEEMQENGIGFSCCWYEKRCFNGRI